MQTRRPNPVRTILKMLVLTIIVGLLLTSFFAGLAWL